MRSLRKVEGSKKNEYLFPQRSAVNTHVSQDNITFVGPSKFGELNVLEFPYVLEKLGNT